MRRAVVLKPYSKCSAEVNRILFMKSKCCVLFGVSQKDFFILLLLLSLLGDTSTSCGSLRRTAQTS